MKLIVGDYIFDDEDGYQYIITLKDGSEYYNINSFLVDNVNDIIKLVSFSNLVHLEYLFSNNKLHNLYKPAMVLSYNKKSLISNFFILKVKNMNMMNG
jgi:hypothetical protein